MLIPAELSVKNITKGGRRGNVYSACNSEQYGH